MTSDHFLWRHSHPQPLRSCIYAKAQQYLHQNILKVLEINVSYHAARHISGCSEVATSLEGAAGRSVPHHLSHPLIDCVRRIGESTFAQINCPQNLWDSIRVIRFVSNFQAPEQDRKNSFTNGNNRKIQRCLFIIYCNRMINNTENMSFLVNIHLLWLYWFVLVRCLLKAITWRKSPNNNSCETEF